MGLRLQQVAGKIRGTPDLLISSRFAPGAEAEQGLERSHRLPPAIVAKDEFIEINLELIAAHAMIGSGQPLLRHSATLPLVVC